MLAAIDWNLIGIVGVGLLLAVVNFGGPLLKAVTSIPLPGGDDAEPIVDSDAKPSAETRAYIESISTVNGATDTEVVRALMAGQSPAEFMRTLLVLRSEASKKTGAAK